MTSKVKLSGIRLRLYEVIFESDTPAGRMYDIVLLLCIVVSVIIVALESVASIQEEHDRLLFLLEWFFTIIFTIDYVARIWVVPYKKKYLFSFFGIIDLLSILPTYLGLFFVGAQSLMVIRSIRLLRIFRIFKLS